MRTRVLPIVAAFVLLPAQHAHAQELKPTLVRVAAAWHEGNVTAVTAIGADAGISIDVDGNTVGPLGPRQAAAVLRRVFEDCESVSARATMTRTVGGDPARAFGEITWTKRVRGTTIPEKATLFIAFVLEGEAWRITEIRLMQ